MNPSELRKGQHNSTPSRVLVLDGRKQDSPILLVYGEWSSPCQGEHNRAFQQATAEYPNNAVVLEHRALWFDPEKWQAFQWGNLEETPRSETAVPVSPPVTKKRGKSSVSRGKQKGDGERANAPLSVMGPLFEWAQVQQSDEVKAPHDVKPSHSPPDVPKALPGQPEGTDGEKDEWEFL